MSSNSEQKILAQALYEIRLLLSGYLGSANEGPLGVRQAAHLAYALHNQALSAVAGDAFDVGQALRSVAAVDAMLGSQFVSRFAEAGITSQA
jgi:hypothetical protein